MSVLRNQPKGARFASFGLGLCVFALIPTETGYQDIASLLARQPGVTERWQKRVVASAVASIQVATFSFGRPIGTGTAGVQLARFDSSDSAGRSVRNPLLQPPLRYSAADFPKVDRSLKGDRLAPFKPQISAPPAPPKDDPATSNSSVPGAKTADATPHGEPLDPELQEALNAPPLSQYDISLSLEMQPLSDPRLAPDGTPAERDDPFAVKTATLFFGKASLGEAADIMERWEPGEEPLIVIPDAALDPDMKVKMAALPDAALATVKPAPDGESIASKGEVNADNQRAKTPAERLGLFDPKARAKQEKCLAEAVYFEARGEAVRGQIAVAQVVMNRTFSGFYPTTPCAVVYQNKHRHLACQFTFACDNVRDVVREPDMWDRARKIAKATLDGQLWLPEVGKSTHYHAYWVRPSWVREMKKLYRTGVHTFYRPRNWGDGGDAPSWGTPAETAAISAKLAEVKP